MARDTRDRPVTFCREQGWDVGQHLVGDEGYGPTVIRITGFGESTLLARRVRHDGQPVNARENNWTLSFRDWEPCDAEGNPLPAAPTEEPTPHA